MSDQERNNLPAEPAAESWSLEDAPKVEEELSDRLAEAADTITTELDDLKAALSADEPGGAMVGEQAAPDVAEVAQEVMEPAAASGQPATTGAAKPASAFKPAAELDPESTSDDRLMSMLAWLTMVILQLPIVSIILLLSATNKERPFQRHHAITSLLFYAAAIVFGIVYGILYAILGLVTFGIGYICLWPLFFVPHLFGLYFALQAYNGKRIELPILSDLGRNQGWL